MTTEKYDRTIERRRGINRVQRNMKRSTERNRGAKKDGKFSPNN